MFLNRLSKAIQIVLAIVALAAVVWAFARVGGRIIGQNPEDAGQVELKMLHWGGRVADRIFQTVVEEFEGAHPHIKINRQSVGNQYYMKLQTLIAANDAPDLFFLQARDVPRYVEQGLVADLESFILADTQSINGELNFPDFYPEALDMFRYDGKMQGRGKLYSLPIYFTSLGFYYNKTLFDRAAVAYPGDNWTWDEFVEKARAIGQLDSCYGAWFIPDNRWFRAYLWTYNTDIYTEDISSVRTNDPVLLEALERIHRWQFDESRMMLRLPSDDWTLGSSLWRAGKIGIFGPEGRWATPSYRTEMDQIDWDFATLPRGTRRTNILHTSSFHLSSTTKHPRETWLLLKYLASPSSQKKFASLGLGVPTRKSLAESPVFLNPSVKPSRDDLFIADIDSSRVMQVPLNPKVEDFEIRKIRQCLVSGTLPIPQALQELKTFTDRESASPFGNEKAPPMPWTSIANFLIILSLPAALLCLYYWRRNRPGRLAAREELAGLVMISPWLIGFMVFTALAIGISFLLALTNWSGITTLDRAQWVGMGNYQYMFFNDERILKSLWVTVYYTILIIPLGQLTALAIALLMNNNVKGIGFFQGAWYLPTVLAGVGLAVLWRWVFNTDHGLLNTALKPFLDLVGVSPPDWFGDDALILGVPAFVVMGLAGVGGFMLIYLAGLKAIPKTLYESARIDGAGWWSQFRHITLPMLSPVILFNVVISMIGSFQVFTQVFIMTPNGGNSDATLFYVLYLYMEAFQFHEMGYASGMAWLLFLIVLVFTLVVMKLSERRVHYEGMKL